MKMRCTAPHSTAPAVCSRDDHHGLAPWRGTHYRERLQEALYITRAVCDASLGETPALRAHAAAVKYYMDCTRAAQSQGRGMAAEWDCQSFPQRNANLDTVGM